MSHPRLVLASASPRRRALLEALGAPVEVVVSHAEEALEGPPRELVIENAVRKRDDVHKRVSGEAIIVAADTLVFLGEEVLSKPDTLDEARAMLRRLSGRTHEVLTGLAVADTRTGRCAEDAECTHVTFRPLEDSELARFVDAVRPLDRAGAYTVDGPGSLLVARYEGCYQNVLGLPIVCLDRLLRSLDFSLFDVIDADRALFL